ncbi:transposase [Microseira wollei]|uniref:transposase n=1 Tax=Microseira wollei TaxID=467598 RepID=UPI0027D98025|nr:transposase [Microseira wollei]
MFGRTAVAVSPRYTSQKCSNCGVKVKKSLSTRTHICSCGYVAHRDTNAAINILNLAGAS